MNPVPHKIFPAFYISGYDVASNLDVLYEYDITHILTVASDIKPKWPKKFKYLTISVLDLETENIKQHFQKCNQFIETGRSEGAVLVHCMAGISRSATICIAYILAKLKGTLDDAVGLVKDARPDICPNDGFMKQLQAYEREISGAKDPESTSKDSSNPLPIIPSASTDSKPSTDSTPSSDSTPSTDSISSTDSTPSMASSASVPSNSYPSTSVQTPSLSTTTPHLDTQPLYNPPINNAHTRYCCRMCGTFLFDNTEVLEHDTGRGQTSFDWKRRNHNSHVECTSYFLNEPTQFGDTTELEGKLICPKCTSKFGSWVWAGAQCSCGAWITPAFQVSKARVDNKPIVK